MAGLQKIAGSKIYIGGRVPYLSTTVLADFSGQTWTEIDGWTTTGDLGAEQEAITQTLINQNVTLYSKGVISFPVMSNVFVPILDDAGQIQFAAAQRSCKPFAFKIEWGADCGEESVVTITNADPAVVTWTSHGLEAGTPVTFETTGALPTGLTAGTIYYIVSPTTNAFSVAATVGGAAIATSSAGSGVHTASAQPVGETDLFFGLAMLGSKTGGDASATRLLNMPIQPICKFITV
jgi:hypothetical protein